MDNEKEEIDLTIGELIRRKRQKRIVSSLTITILAVNIVALILLTISFLSINRYQNILIDREADVLGIQSLLYIQALRENALKIDMVEGQKPVATLDPITAQTMMVGLGESSPSEVRLYDKTGSLVFDSQWWAYGGHPTHQDKTANIAAPDDDILMALLSGQTTKKIVKNFNKAPNIRVGRPFKYGADTIGALVLDYNVTFIGDMVRVMRMEIGVIFISGLALMILLSIYLTGVLGQPLKRLARAADSMRRNYGRHDEIPDFTNRNDEIGDLSGALRELTDALQLRMKSIERFAADVSHELKNPLTSLRSAIETLDKIKDPTKIAKLRDIIVHDLTRMDRLISDISAASRLDAELSQDIADSIDLTQFIEMTVERNNMMLKNMADNGYKKLPHIIFENQSSQKIFIQGKGDRLSQVFDNILSNALSFAPEESEITVRLKNQNGVARVSISDQGPGIPENKMDTIFNRFYTDRPFDDKFGNNSGLGLSICRQIIQAHRGRIRAENIKNTDGKSIGARFVIYLPIQIL